MRPDRAMWATGLLLACAVLAGLVLNLVTGLTRLSWAVALAVGVAAAACAGLLIARRRARPAPAAPGRRFRVSPLTGAVLLLAAVLAGGAVWLADASASWHQSPGFAQLWLVPARGTSATLGVRDNYPGRQAFRLVLTGGGKTVSTWQLTLAQGETWQRTVTSPGGGLAATLTTPGRMLEVTS
jgi:hypothetical protein